MKKIFLLLAVLFNCIALVFSQGKVEIDGVLIIGNSEDNTPTPGMIRWTGLDFEGWNGFMWTSLTSLQVTQIITDIDSNEYRTVTIGSQEWMAENLRVTQYNDSTGIAHVTGNSQWSGRTTGAWCWYNNDNSYDTPYGKLYNFHAVETGKLCPTGWHVPSDEEWTILINLLGGTDIAGGKMKAAGTTRWNSPNTGATNESGFTGLPGGWRSSSGDFFSMGSDGYWYSSTATSGVDGGSYFILFDFKDDVGQSEDDKESGYSVRCVRD